VARTLILLAVRFALTTFYRVRRLGVPLPAEGPLLIVANHPNALVDPVMVLTTVDRELALLGKEPLLRMPILGWFIRTVGLIPVFRAQDGADTGRNQEAFRAVREQLHAGGAVAIFPEGKSHDEPALQRLKTGAARMALDVDPRLAGEVRIVPIGLVYSDKGRFRSKAAVWIGEPVDVGADRVGPEDEALRWAAVERLTERIGHGLERVTVNLESWEEWDLLRLAQRIWRPARGAARVERLAALSRAAGALRRQAPHRLEALSRRIAAFGRALDELGVPADRLEQRYRTTRVLRYLAKELTLLALGAPFAAAAVLFWLPPYLLVRVGVRLARISGDLLATVKVISSSVLFVAWLVATCVFAAVERGPLAALGVALLAPTLGRLALGIVEDHLRLLREVRIFLRHLTGDSMRAALIRERDSIAEEFDLLAASSFAAPGGDTEPGRDQVRRARPRPGRR
jgi:glycerol-3-phosphate O-acyltransferase/dihydroxyacetone phosphate acyltransferase